jgi:hypothetical protein
VYVSQTHILEFTAMLETIYNTITIRDEGDNSYLLRIFFEDPFTDSVHSLVIKVLTKVDVLFDIANVKWSGDECSLLSDTCYNFMVRLEDLLRRPVTNYSDPCIRRFAYNNLVVPYVINQQCNFVGFTLEQAGGWIDDDDTEVPLSFQSILHALHTMSMQKYYRITYETNDFEMIIYPENPAQSEECGICFEKLVASKCHYSLNDKISLGLKCDTTHYFHLDCLSRWVETTPKCPFCRRSLSPSFFRHYRAMCHITHAANSVDSSFDD